MAYAPYEEDLTNAATSAGKRWTIVTKTHQHLDRRRVQRVEFEIDDYLYCDHA